MTAEVSSQATRRSRGRPSVEGMAEIDGEILRIALEQFIAHGYGISMSRIVQAAGISKNTMYSRFSSKEELFRALIRRQIEKVAETMPLGAPEASYDLEHGLRNYANRTLEVSLEGDFIEVNRLIYSEARRFPELGIAASERTALGLRQVTRFIRERAEVEGIPCRDPGTVAEVLIMALRGWYVTALLREEGVTGAAREDWVERTVATLIASRAEW